MSTAEKTAYSIKQWCAELGISEALFYKRQRGSLGPRVANVGARTIITETPREYLQRFAREIAPPQEQPTQSPSNLESGTEPVRRSSSKLGASP
jgi:hypothetical protein